MSALGGWIVTFMIRVRHGARFASGMTATGFWLGITVSRVTLGFVTGRLGEKLAISVNNPNPNPNPTTHHSTPPTPTNQKTDLPGPSNDMPTPLLANPTILRLRRGHRPPRLLPRPPLPHQRRRRHKTPPQTPPRRRHWLRRQRGRLRCGAHAVRRGGDCAEQGGGGVAAGYFGVGGGDFGGLGWVAEVAGEGGEEGVISGMGRSDSGGGTAGDGREEGVIRW